MKWGVIILPAAEKQLVATKDKRIREGISRRINGLENDPERQGKLLTDELAGYRSIRAVGQRYRIIYKIEAERVIVLVVTIGIRKEKDKKDAYELAKKLARLGLLDVE
ncbi:MAG: type II toxin-antitoxin system RelE family toxin [Ktedonobacteraceae bacterium]